MTEIILGLIIVGLIVKSYFDEKDNKREREVLNKELIKVALSKNLQEYDTSSIIDKNVPKEETLPDEIPFDEITQSQFEKALDINGTNES